MATIDLSALFTAAKNGFIRVAQILGEHKDRFSSLTVDINTIQSEPVDGTVYSIYRCLTPQQARARALKLTGYVGNVAQIVVYPVGEIVNQRVVNALDPGSPSMNFRQDSDVGMVSFEIGESEMTVYSIDGQKIQRDAVRFAENVPIGDMSGRVVNTNHLNESLDAAIDLDLNGVSAPLSDPIQIYGPEFRSDVIKLSGVPNGDVYIDIEPYRYRPLVFQNNVSGYNVWVRYVSKIEIVPPGRHFVFSATWVGQSGIGVLPIDERAERRCGSLLTAVSTVANSTADRDLITLPAIYANSVKVGQTFIIKALGVVSQGAVASTYSFWLKVNGVKVAASIITSQSTDVACTSKLVSFELTAVVAALDVVVTPAQPETPTTPAVPAVIAPGKLKIMSAVLEDGAGGIALTDRTRHVHIDPVDIDINTTITNTVKVGCNYNTANTTNIITINNLHAKYTR